jgi:hypothetical protein
MVVVWVVTLVLGVHESVEYLKERENSGWPGNRRVWAGLEYRLLRDEKELLLVFKASSAQVLAL